MSWAIKAAACLSQLSTLSQLLVLRCNVSAHIKRLAATGKLACVSFPSALNIVLSGHASIETQNFAHHLRRMDALQDS